MLARLAQAVEHFIGNEEVPGSTPGVSTRIGSVTRGSAKLVAGQVEGSDSDENRRSRRGTPDEALKV